jgi:NDP-sugar pyrophosphorylase family protein
MNSLILAFDAVDATFCVAYRSEDVENFVRKNKPTGMEVSFVKDRGDSNDVNILRNLTSLISGPFIWLAGDVIALPEVYVNSLASLTVGNVVGTVSFSPDLTEAITHPVGKVVDGKVTELLYPPPSVLSVDHLRDMTIWSLNRTVFDLIDLNKQGTTIFSLLDCAMKNGQQVAGNLYLGRWLHISYAEDLKKTMRV